MEEKNYLDIAATAEQVKKGIEEVVEALTSDILENNNKVFTLEVAEDLNEESTAAELLEGVKIRLEKVSAIAPIEVNEGEMPVGDGEDWLKKSHLYSSFFPTSDISNGEYTEVRFGPDMINEPKIPYPDGRIGYNTSRFVISGNPLAVEDETNLSTNSDTRVKANDAKTFKLVVAETANAVFEDSSKTSFKDNSNFSVDGEGLHFAADNNNWDKNRFTLTDGANMDITGDVSGSPEVYVHGKCFLNLDRGYDPTYKRYNYAGNNVVINDLEGATIAVHDKSMLDMSRGSYLKTTDWAQAYFAGASFFMVADGAQVSITQGAQVSITQEANLAARGTSKVFLNGGAITLNPHTYSPCIHMSGGGTILFNAREDKIDPPISNTLDPLLLANPTSFIFIGQGAAGTADTGEPVIEGASGWFGYKRNLIPSNRNPRVQIADETEVTIDAASGGGANWIKIGAGNGGLVYISLTGNIFQQMNGNAYFDMSDDTHFEMHQSARIEMYENAHAEIHDDSKLIMRGMLTEHPWRDGKHLDSLGRNWIRPILTNNSPVLGMYDIAQFTMRGVWDTSSSSEIHFSQPISIDYSEILSSMEEEEVNVFQSQINDFLEAKDDEKTLRTVVEEGKISLPEEIKKLIIEAINNKGNNYTGFEDEYDFKTMAESNDFNELPTSDGKIIQTMISRTDISTLYISNIVISDKPLDWQEHLDKIEDQPIVEIIENADVRIYGNSELKLTDYSIIANSGGFTFKDNTVGEEVSFSISELKELKKLLTGATITESE